MCTPILISKGMVNTHMLQLQPDATFKFNEY